MHSICHLLSLKSLIEIPKKYLLSRHFARETGTMILQKWQFVLVFCSTYFCHLASCRHVILLHITWPAGTASPLDLVVPADRKLDDKSPATTLRIPNREGGSQQWHTHPDISARALTRAVVYGFVCTFVSRMNILCRSDVEPIVAWEMLSLIPWGMIITIQN